MVAQAAQMNALVIDFGGGTCDVCIIETTRQGEISGGGRNMRPLAGKSLPLGGFSINREIAEYLLFKTFPGQKSQIRTGIQEYKTWQEGKRSLHALDPKYQAFIENFHRLIHRAEALKLALCRAVTDWSLTADQRFPVATTVPQDPFEPSGKALPATLSIADLRDIFVQKVYNPSLKPFLTERLKIGRDILEHRPIHVTLLSGGSANIRWLRELLKRDYAGELSNAPIVQIPDYQQVVAQGLAVDCAREFSTGTSDFKGVTYNPLYLLLSPDDSGCEPRPFFKKTVGLPDVKDRPGLLVPTASVLASFVDHPMLWRVKMSRPPRRKLDYYFLQGTMDPSDISSLQNVEEHTIHTPPNCDFDGSSHIQLTIKSDGTAVPRVVYRAGTSVAKEIGKDGRKFFVDMTDAGGTAGEAYLGLDFGTSNSAVSYVDRSWVELIESRSKEEEWRELTELVELLPMPMAVPLARYIGDVMENSPVPPGPSFLEAALCLAAYTSYMEFCSLDRRKETKLFKGFPHRSSGYLWHLLKVVQEQLGKGATFTRPFERLLEPKNRALIDTVVTGWTAARHEISIQDKGQLLSAVRLLANTCNLVFSPNTFGYFEGVQKERFSSRHTGRFRFAVGKPPFSRFAVYKGPTSFSESESYVVNCDKGVSLLLSPLVFWYPCLTHRDTENGHCYLFDKVIGEGAKAAARFKAAGFSCTLEVDRSNVDMSALLDQILQIKDNDPKLERLEGITCTAAPSA